MGIEFQGVRAGFWCKYSLWQVFMQDDTDILHVEGTFCAFNTPNHMIRHCRKNCSSACSGMLRVRRHMAQASFYRQHGFINKAGHVNNYGTQGFACTLHPTLQLR
jgi:hypothetical protein